MLARRPFLQWPAHYLGLLEAHSQTSHAERQMLARYASGRSRLAEIGVYQGVTARVLTSVMDPDGVYYAVDPYPGGRLGVDFNYLIARREVGRGARGRVVWIRTTGAVAPLDPVLREAAVDFLFVDGDHSYEGLKQDWEAWRGLLAPSAAVGLHDTRGGTFPCQRYMEEVIARDPAFRIADALESLTILQRA